MVTNVNKIDITFIVGQLNEKLARWWCGLVVVNLLMGILWEDYVETQNDNSNNNYNNNTFIDEPYISRFDTLPKTKNKC